MGGHVVGTKKNYYQNEAEKKKRNKNRKKMRDNRKNKRRITND